MLELTNVAVDYGKLRAVHDASLFVDEGELVTIIGPNGAGKSTTLNTIGGLLAPSTGTITYQDEPSHGLSADEIVTRGLSLCPEGQRVFPDMTVRDNLLLGGYRTSDGAEERLASILDLFPRLAERIDYRGNTLSGGERQMLAIGRALMSDPDMLLLDEPSHGLAPKIVEDVSEAILELNQDRDLTILLVEQNARLAFNLADRGYVMENGSIVESGSIPHLRESPLVRESYLGKMTE